MKLKLLLNYKFKTTMINLFEDFDLNEYCKLDLVASIPAIPIDDLLGLTYPYIYRIINNLNDKYYIGIHFGELDDIYYGSGVDIRSDIRIYGIDNFTKEILIIAEDIDQAFDYEAQIVTEELVEDPQCYNKCLGGRGGWFRNNKLAYYKSRIKAAKTIKDRIDAGDYNYDYLRTEEVKLKIINAKRAPGGYYSTDGPKLAAAKAQLTKKLNGTINNWYLAAQTAEALWKRSNTDKEKYKNGDKSMTTNLSLGRSKYIYQQSDGKLRVAPENIASHHHKDWIKLIKITDEQYKVLSYHTIYDLSLDQLVELIDDKINNPIPRITQYNDYVKLILSKAQRRPGFYAIYKSEDDKYYLYFKGCHGNFKNSLKFYCEFRDATQDILDKLFINELIEPIEE